MSKFFLTFFVFSTIMAFLLCLIVAFAWKILVFSSHRVAHLILPLCCQYTLCWSKMLVKCSSNIFLKFYSSKDKSLNSSRVSRKYIKIVLCSIVFDRLESYFCHCLRILLVAFIFETSLFASFGWLFGIFQALSIICMNSSCSI
jgi:hypothetical protein